MVQIKAAYLQDEIIGGAEMLELLQNGTKAFVNIKGGCLNPTNDKGKVVPIGGDNLKQLLKDETGEVYINFIDDTNYGEALASFLA